MNTNRDNERLSIAVETTVKSCQAEIIEYRLLISGKEKIVRCLVDYPDGGINIAACAAINKKIVAFLEKENILGSNFLVEVNSPGLDRTLKTRNDFLRVKGKIVSLWFKRDIGEKKFIEAKVIEVSSEALTIEHKEELLSVSLDDIASGKEKIEIK